MITESKEKGQGINKQTWEAAQRPTRREKGSPGGSKVGWEPGWKARSSWKRGSRQSLLFTLTPTTLVARSYTWTVLLLFLTLKKKKNPWLRIEMEEEVPGVQSGRLVFNIPSKTNIKKTLKAQESTTQLGHREGSTWEADNGPGAACSNGPWHTRGLCWTRTWLVEIKMNRYQCWVETCVFNQKLHLFPNLFFPSNHVQISLTYKKRSIYHVLVHASQKINYTLLYKVIFCINKFS